MTSGSNKTAAENNELAKDPKDWKSSDDPATPSQMSYLKSLAEQAGKELPQEDMTKAEASEEIDLLRKEAGIES